MRIIFIAYFHTSLSIVLNCLPNTYYTTLFLHLFYKFSFFWFFWLNSITYFTTNTLFFPILSTMNGTLFFITFTDNRTWLGVLCISENKIFEIIRLIILMSSERFSRRGGSWWCTNKEHWFLKFGYILSNIILFF